MSPQSHPRQRVLHKTYLILLVHLLLLLGTGCNTFPSEPGPLLPGYQYRTVSIDPEPIAAAQKKAQWCWAAGCEMLARSQGVDLPQEWFVSKQYGPHLPDVSTKGSFEPIKQALTGEYTTVDGRRIQMSGAYHYGIPTDPVGMIQSIKEGRPFILAAFGHVYVCYGLKYHTHPYIRVVELHLIDPLWKHGRPKYQYCNVYRDSPRPINGTFELLVRERR